MSVSERRFEVAQESERDYWHRVWKDNSARQIAAEKYWQHYIGLLKKMANVTPNDRILDVGCGPCGLIRYLDGGHRYGLDPLMDYYLSNFDMPEQVDWRKGCGESIPFPDRFFDVVITTNALDHSHNPQEMVNEIRRVLRDEGHLFLTINAHSTWAKMVKSFAEKVGLGDPAHPHTWTETDVKRLLRHSGLNTIATLKGIGDMGSWGRRSKMFEVGTSESREENDFTRAVTILRAKGLVTVLKRVTGRVLVKATGAGRWPRDTVFLAVGQL